jgi:3-phosphoshikimate 1-carboxyvinyltransferase
MNSITLPPISRIEGTLKLPGSKSLSNRALLLATLSKGCTTLHNLLDAEDVQHMLDALQSLGVSLTRSVETPSTLTLEGTGGHFPVRSAHCFLGNSGTSMRSLAAALCIGQGDYILEGEPRMYERPIGDLIDGLKALGAEIDYLGQEGYPPLHIKPASLKGGMISISGKTSSQYLSAVLMLAPYAETPVSIRISDELISKPYVLMTIDIMQTFGVHVQANADYSQFDIPLGHYTSPHEYWIESDASSASYFLAAGAIAGGTVRLEGIGKQSIQGDSRFAEVLARMGATVRYEAQAIEIDRAQHLQGIDIDMNDMPDAAMTLAIVGLFAATPVTIRNIASWKVKETDRLHALSTELRKVGATIETGEDWICVHPLKKEQWQQAEIATYNDHRIAMCFSLVALGGVPVTILDPRCTAKTFPTYFETFKTLYT